VVQKLGIGVEGQNTNPTTEITEYTEEKNVEQCKPKKHSEIFMPSVV
jgi:hypothetical protein